MIPESGSNTKLFDEHKIMLLGLRRDFSFPFPLLKPCGELMRKTHVPKAQNLRIIFNGKHKENIGEPPKTPKWGSTMSSTLPHHDHLNKIPRKRCAHVATPRQDSVAIQYKAQPLKGV